MQIAIIQFPGSNCERETMLAVKRAGMEPIEFLWNESIEKLQAMDGYIIVGGFSYEDRSRAGIIAALDPVMQALKNQSELGKPILGICNGAQILVESGLVPGLENNKLAMTLTANKRIAHGKVVGTGYYNAWINMRLSDHYQRNAFTHRLTPTDILHVPVAHGEGRFVMTEALWQEINQQGLAVFQYCDVDGNIIDHFPTNPNGSLHNIAAISNKSGNVMAMMPHPERTSIGDAIFKSMRDYLVEGHIEKRVPLYYYPRRITMPTYQLDGQSDVCIVELTITDNQALTVQTTLQQLGIPVKVKRQIHWEIDCDSPEVLLQIKKSGVLFNARKEREVLDRSAHSILVDDLITTSAAFLVSPRDDILCQQKQQMLSDQFHIQGIRKIKHGVLWHFSCENGNISDYIVTILNTNIISNPNAHDCYQY